MTGSAQRLSFGYIRPKKVASAEQKAVGLPPNKSHLLSVRRQIADREESARRRQGGGTRRKKLRKVTRRRK